MNDDGGIEEGRRLRDEGMRKATAHVNPVFKAAVMATVLQLAKSGQVFGAGDVTAVVGPPENKSDGNFIGSYFRTAAREGLIVQAGTEQATRASRHGSLQKSWRGTGLAKTYRLPVIAPDLADRLPQGQMSILEPAWHCPNCDTEIDAKYVKLWDIAPRYGEAGCPKCLKKVTVQLR